MTSRQWWRGLETPACLLLFAASCGAPRAVTLPSGAGTPFPEFAPAYAESTTDCRAVKTMSASLSLSGRAGATKLSARIDAGFAEPGRLRLEGFPRVSFGGKPFFVLAAHGADATLVLTRDARVLRGAEPAAIIEALTGIALDPDQLRAVVSGCALGVVQPTEGRSFSNGWASVDAGDTTVFLRQIEGRWRLAAARRGSLTLDYTDFSSGRPSTLHLHTIPGPGIAPADLTLRISQVDINTPLDNAVFHVDVPRDAAPLTLEELRRAGPLGDRDDEPLAERSRAEGAEDARQLRAENAEFSETNDRWDLACARLRALCDPLREIRPCARRDEHV